jgi:hypothetical protein
VRFDEFADKWGPRYPAIVNLWRSAWEEFIPFLDYDVEIRKIICSTNAIESLNARYRRAVRARGHFPTDQAALKCLYLVTRSSTPPAADGPAGQCAGSQRSTPSRSHSKAVSFPAPPTESIMAGYTVDRIDPLQARIVLGVLAGEVTIAEADRTRDLRHRRSGRRPAEPHPLATSNSCRGGPTGNRPVNLRPAGGS